MATLLIATTVFIGTGIHYFHFNPETGLSIISKLEVEMTHACEGTRSVMAHMCTWVIRTALINIFACFTISA